MAEIFNSQENGLDSWPHEVGPFRLYPPSPSRPVVWTMSYHDLWVEGGYEDAAACLLAGGLLLGMGNDGFRIIHELTEKSREQMPERYVPISVADIVQALA